MSYLNAARSQGTVFRYFATERPPVPPKMITATTPVLYIASSSLAVYSNSLFTHPQHPLHRAAMTLTRTRLCALTYCADCWNRATSDFTF